LPNLQELSFLLLYYGEVMTITMDDEGLLEAGQWAFSLNVASKEFEKEVGKKSSAVTWRVILGGDNKEEKGLWQLAAEWEPSKDWLVQRTVICTGAGSSWYNILRAQRASQSSPRLL
jgi:hypothetical protein